MAAPHAGGRRAEFREHGIPGPGDRCHSAAPAASRRSGPRRLAAVTRLRSPFILPARLARPATSMMEIAMSAPTETEGFWRLRSPGGRKFRAPRGRVRRRKDTGPPNLDAEGAGRGRPRASVAARHERFFHTATGAAHASASPETATDDEDLGCAPYAQFRDAELHRQAREAVRVPPSH
jgi:hypothetical protein